MCPDPNSRDEHLAWCKERALKYVDAADLLNAVASMGSDLMKHSETREQEPLMMMAGMMRAAEGDIAGVRRWIEGFR